MRALAARRSASLAVLFLGVYGGCNWLTAQRTDVSLWYFEWERLIPFWPVMIVPYLSIDAFFLGAPFLCRDRVELGVLTRRIVAALLAAGLCFAAFPFQFAFERPAVDGWEGILFDGVASLDRPFNLFPSLHVTLGTILAEIYSRHTRGLTRIALLVWFTLIGLSTVLTFQHHVVDVAGGLLLAAVVFSVIPARNSRQYSTTRHVCIGMYYGLGGGIMAVLAAMLWPWSALLLWPTLSLGIVSAAYVGAGPSVFGKVNGRIRLFARMLMWPYLLGQRASLAYYRRLCRPYDVVAPGVWIGRRLNEDEAARLAAQGLTAVLDLTADFDEPRALTRLTYKNVQILDLAAPSDEALDAAVRFVSDQWRHGVIYVHCKIGYSRSAAVVGAWLLASRRAGTTDEALAIVRDARPQAIVRPEAVAAIRRFEARLAGSAARSDWQTPAGRFVSLAFAAAARLLCGAPRSADAALPARARVYFANHTSHLDFVAIWGSLPPAVRARTRPVVARDYWDGGRIRRTVSRHVLRAVLVDRAQEGMDRTARITGARESVRAAVDALDAGLSLIIFPEGTRGSGGHIAPFKSGLYHLCRARPDVDLVPVFLENLHRILPRGEAVPLPLRARIAFGRPIRLRPDEDKTAFLERARAALLMVEDPCTFLSTAISRAS